MGLSSAGIGSNLPVDSIISQLMTVEQAPLTALDKKVASFQAKLSAMGTIKSALATFQTAIKGLSDVGKFQAVSATIGDAAVATVSGSATASLGSYSLEVSKLAQAQKLASAGQASTTAAIGAGTITFDLGTISGGSFDAASGKYTGAGFASSGSVQTVTIGAGDTSLSGIRDAINKAKVGVTASIVNDGSGTPYRLVLTESASGKASSMKITVGGDAALGALLNHDPAAAAPAGQAMSEMVSAQNAEFKLDGIAISSASNTAANVIDGLTLNLAKTNVGNPTSVVLARDTASVVASVGQFVSAYNAINKTMTDLTAYNPTTKIGAVLNGDSTVRGIQTQLRALLTSPVATGGTAFNVLSQIGVTVKSGIMAVDDAKLKSTIESNFTDVAGLFAAVGRPSDSLVAFKSATANTVPGSYAVNVTQAASKGNTAAIDPAGLNIGSGNDTITVQLNGVSSTVTLAQGIYADADALAAEVQSKINGVAAFGSAGSSVNVTQSGGKLTITSNQYGPASNVIVSGVGAGNLLGAAPNTNAGTDVAGTIGTFAATGSGRTLTAAAGNPTEGLALLVDGSGSRGTVNYSQGYAYQFDRFATALLDSTGSLTSHTDGLSASIKSLADSRQRLTDRLAETEKRYRAQYSALDASISSMNTTSAYLTQQLAQLAKL
ncbi:MAG: flagellar hook protein FliD [Massilia sp.]|nr:flagellar hook protein FliD [Massilia sp.]